MLKKIWEFIKKIFKSIINWFKNLFKREKVVIFNGKEILVEKPKFPVVSALIDIGSSVIDSKSNINKPKIKQIDEEIKDLINNLSSLEVIDVEKTITNIEDKIEKARKEVRGSFKEDKIIKKELAILDKQQHTLDTLRKAYKEDDKLEERVVANKDKVQVKTNKIDDKVEIVNIVNSNTKLQKVDTIKEEKDEIKESEVVLENKNVDNTPKKLIAYKEYVKYTNQLLKDGSKLIKSMISELSINSDLELNKIKIEELKKKIIEIRKQYYDFKHSDYIYIIEQDFELNQLDEFEVIKSSEKIDFYLNKCNSILQTMEYMKTHKEVIETKKKETKKEEKNEKAKEKKEETPKIILEIEQANMMVIKDIKSQQKEISRFLAKMESIPVPERRGRRLGFFSNFLNNTLRFGFGFINIFRNRNLCLLTNGYLLNNRLRLLRRIINPNIDVECITFNRRIKNEIDIINNYQTICNDSLYQITSLKEEFVRSFGYNVDNEELKEVFTKLVNLEEQITVQQQNLVNAKIKINSKIKVRKFIQ